MKESSIFMTTGCKEWILTNEAILVTQAKVDQLCRRLVATLLIIHYNFAAMTSMHCLVLALCLLISFHVKIGLSYGFADPRFQNVLAFQHSHSTSLRRLPSLRCADEHFFGSSVKDASPQSLGTILLLFETNPQTISEAEQGFLPPNFSADDKLIIQEAIGIYRQSVTEADFGTELAKFRKVILSLDKYRINDPGSMALKYNKLLRLSLTVPECWGGAANAVEYAGLYFPKYIQFDSDTQTNTLNATGLWRDTLTQLLDMEYQSSTIATQLGDTWDQKFFAQSELSVTSALAVHDMLFYIFRLALHISLVNNNVKSIDVMFSEVGTEIIRFFPSMKWLQLAIRRDHNLDAELISPALLKIMK